MSRKKLDRQKNPFTFAVNYVNIGYRNETRQDGSEAKQMKKILQRALLMGLAAGMLCTTALAALHTPVDRYTLALADSVSLVEGGIELRDETDERAVAREHILTYSPDDTVWPVVAYGSTLYGRSTMPQTAKYLTDNGLSVVAAVNGSFFDMINGIPYGIVVTDGVLRSSGSGYAIGFFEDGSAIIGEPELTVSMLTPDGARTGLFYNKALSLTNGIGLYSPDYDTKTKNTISAYNVVLQPVEKSDTALRLNGSIRAKVTGMMDATPSCPIPDGCFVLAIAEGTAYASALKNLQALKIGDEVTILTESSEEWEDVRYACGGGELLVEDGRALDEFSLDTAKERKARTAAGLQKDGTLVLYTVDKAERDDRSDGMTLAELAERMQEEDCEIALNLDGGGSTALGAQYPGYASCSTVNSPADGSLRPCANFIYLVRKQTIARQATQLQLYPYATPVLPGAKIAMTLKAVDTNYMAASLPGTASYSAADGTVTADGVLTVDAGARGTVTVNATAGDLRTQVELPVLEQVSEIAVMKQAGTSALKTLTVAAGSKTELKASARYYGQAVAAQNGCFTWQADEQIGSVDANGVFTAANVTGRTSGVLTVSYGQTSTEIKVTVAEADPFADMKNHWAKTYVNEMYYDGVLAGAAGADGKLRYRPDDSMTRQEFVVALMRFMQVEPGGYASVSLPFVDADDTASWAMDAMKAAYSLGYVGGSSSNGKLYGNPDSTITRQEAMVILARAQGLITADDRTALSRFSDANLVADWAAESLAAMIERGIIGGSNGKLNPTGKVTRAEVAKMLYALKYQQ